MFVSFVRSVFVRFNQTAKNCIFMICCNPVKIKGFMLFSVTKRLHAITAPPN